jgi:hypothetical protein
MYITKRQDMTSTFLFKNWKFILCALFFKNYSVLSFPRTYFLSSHFKNKTCFSWVLIPKAKQSKSSKTGEFYFSESLKDLKSTSPFRRVSVFFYFIVFTFTHMCIHCLGHLPLPPPPPPLLWAESLMFSL